MLTEASAAGQVHCWRAERGKGHLLLFSARAAWHGEKGYRQWLLGVGSVGKWWKDVQRQVGCWVAGRIRGPARRGRGQGSGAGSGFPDTLSCSQAEIRHTGASIGAAGGPMHAFSAEKYTRCVRAGEPHLGWGSPPEWALAWRGAGEGSLPVGEAGIAVSTRNVGVRPGSAQKLARKALAASSSAASLGGSVASTDAARPVITARRSASGLQGVRGSP